jgi:general secretion pathway protein E
MIATLPARPSQPPTVARAARPGRLFNAEDFVLADLQPTEIWERVSTIAIREQASDVHFTCQADGMYVALRLDGRLHPQGIMPLELGQRVTNHVKVLARLDVSERRRPQDGHVGLSVDGRGVECRISVLPTNHGEAVAVRILDREAALLDVEELGFSECQLDDLSTLIDCPNGLVLVTGATGAGKTTTLYAILRRLASADRKIIAVENPIEYDLPGIDQCQVNHKIDLDFATLIRSVLRQDPNVIMIGEVRDAETADAVVRAANSGRLVFATTHAVHSAAAIESLIALGAHPHFVARSFRGVIAQTLVRRLCRYCTIRLEETSDTHMLEDVQRWLEPHERPVLSMGRGCPHCRHTGYRGRSGIFEILVADDQTRALISRRAPAREVYDTARARMIRIADAGKLAVLRGQTTIEELLQNVSEIWTGGN